MSAAANLATSIAIAAVAAEEDDLVEAVASHLVADILQHHHNQVTADDDGAGQVRRFVIDAVGIGVEDDGRFEIGSATRNRVAREHIGTQR